MTFMTLSIAKLFRLEKVVEYFRGLEKNLVLTVKILGVVYLIYILLTLFTIYFERIQHGPYFVYLFGVGYLFILTQLFWFKKLSKSYLFKFVAGFSFIIEFEKLVIILTALHRDYIPSSWKYNSYMFDEMVGFVVTIFVLFILNKFLLQKEGLNNDFE